MYLRIGIQAADVPLSSMNLGNRTHNALHKVGLSNLGQLLERTGGEIVRLRGLGSRCRSRLERALSQVAAVLPAHEAARARDLIQEILAVPERAKYLPTRSRPEPVPVPSDIRRLLTGLNGLRHRPSVAIMKHRLGLDTAGERPPVGDTMAALEVTRNAVTLADFKVTHRLRQGADFQPSREWLRQALDALGGLATYDELEERLDPAFPVEPLQLAAALRLLERVEGREITWERLPLDTLVDRALLRKLREISAQGEKDQPAPISLIELADWLGRQLGSPLRPDRAALIAERIWGGTVHRFGPGPALLLSYTGEPSLRHWASALLLQAGTPLRQASLIQALAGLPCGKPDIPNLWGALEREPRAVKTAPSTWAWLPRLGLGEGRIRGWVEACRDILDRAGDAMECAILRDMLAGPDSEPSAPMLRWILKRDARFRVKRERISAVPDGLAS